MAAGSWKDHCPRYAPNITPPIVVEITPIGIQNLGWKFWIVWTVTNAVFLPTLYFLYPETANRSLEDIDAYYRTNRSLVVTKDPDAICRRRPQKYIDRENEEIQRSAASKHAALGSADQKEGIEEVKLKFFGW